VAAPVPIIYNRHINSVNLFPSQPQHLIEAAASHQPQRKSRESSNILQKNLTD